MYNAQNNIPTNKAIAPAQATPLDARSYFDDTSLGISRPYQSKQEVFDNFPVAKNRKGEYPVIINVGGTLGIDGTFTGGINVKYWWTAPYATISDILPDLFSSIQATTTAVSVTIASKPGNILLIIDPPDTLATFAATMPAVATDGQLVDMAFGGTKATGVVVNAFSVTPNTGQHLIQSVALTGSSTTPIRVFAGESVSWKYRASNSTWYRVNH